MDMYVDDAGRLALYIECCSHHSSRFSRSYTEPLEELSGSNAEGLREADDIDEGEIALPTLRTTHVGPINPRLRGKLLLRKFSFVSILPQRLAKPLQNLTAG
jgi:hypothetical protein